MPSTTPGTTSGNSSRLASGPRTRELAAHEAERRRHAERKADHGREYADLEAQREAVDELPLVEDRGEPAQAVALRREGRDFLPEEGEPGHEDQRHQDIGQRDRRRAVQRPAAGARRDGVMLGPRRRREISAWMARSARAGHSVFLWNWPAFMMTERCWPPSWNRPRSFSGSPSTTIRSAKAPGCDGAELAFLAHDLGADQGRRADDVDRPASPRRGT